MIERADDLERRCARVAYIDQRGTGVPMRDLLTTCGSADAVRAVIDPVVSRNRMGAVLFRGILAAIQAVVVVVTLISGKPIVAGLASLAVVAVAVALRSDLTKLREVAPALVADHARTRALIAELVADVEAARRRSTAEGSAGTAARLDALEARVHALPSAHVSPRRAR